MISFFFFVGFISGTALEEELISQVANNPNIRSLADGDNSGLIRQGVLQGLWELNFSADERIFKRNYLGLCPEEWFEINEECRAPNSYLGSGDVLSASQLATPYQKRLMSRQFGFVYPKLNNSAEDFTQNCPSNWRLKNGFCVANTEIKDANPGICCSRLNLTGYDAAMKKSLGQYCGFSFPTGNPSRGPNACTSTDYSGGCPLGRQQHDLGDTWGCAKEELSLKFSECARVLRLPKVLTPADKARVADLCDEAWPCVA